MRQRQNFRVVKRGLAGAGVTAALEVAASAPRPVVSSTATPAQTEREMRRVVAGWVSEHRRAADDLRRALAHSLLLRA